MPKFKVTQKQILEHSAMIEAVDVIEAKYKFADPATQKETTVVKNAAIYTHKIKEDSDVKPAA